MAGENIISQFLSKAIANGSKSTVLKPISGVLGGCIGSIIIAEYCKFDLWIIILFAIFSVLSFILFLWAYVFSIKNNPESLRSEKYSIQKLAIERGIVGDSINGKIDPKSIKLHELMGVNSVEVPESIK